MACRCIRDRAGDHFPVQGDRFPVADRFGSLAIDVVREVLFTVRLASLQQFVDRLAAGQDWDWAARVGEGVSRRIDSQVSVHCGENFQRADRASLWDFAFGG